MFIKGLFLKTCQPPPLMFPVKLSNCSEQLFKKKKKERKKKKKLRELLLSSSVNFLCCNIN